MTVFLIVLGGGFGAVARWWISIKFPKTQSGFPVGITIVNVVGSLALGLVVGLTASGRIAFATEPITIGLLGGFTTFSTWMVDIDEVPSMRAGISVSALPLIFGLIAAAVGLWLGVAI